MSTCYRDSAGWVVTNAPWLILDYCDMTRTADPADFDTIERARPTTEENR